MNGNKFNQIRLQMLVIVANIYLQVRIEACVDVYGYVTTGGQTLVMTWGEPYSDVDLVVYIKHEVQCQKCLFANQN